MTIRRDRRPSQVRPRPPSNGRPSPPKIRPRSPAPGRLTLHRDIERGPGLPLATRILLVVAVAALGAAILLTSSGMLGRAVGGIGGAFSGVVGKLVPPTPSPSRVPVSQPPVLEPPAESYTNQPTVDLSATVPAAVAGRDGYTLRIYQLLKGQPPQLKAEIPVGETTSVLAPGISLSDGANDFQATILGPGGESESSAVITYILDTAPPKVTITAPKNGATVNGGAATITGRTQGRSSIVARNTTNGLTTTAAAAADGTFTLTIQLASGANIVTLTATDPAGNSGAATITIRKGQGQTKVSLKASASTISVTGLPQQLTLTAVAKDPDGQPLANTVLTFTLSIPGIPALTNDVTTDQTGTAVFTTTIPRGAAVGNGLATVLLRAGTTSVSARQVITLQ